MPLQLSLLPEDVIGVIATFFDIDDLSHYVNLCNSFQDMLTSKRIHLYNALSKTKLYNLKTLPNWYTKNQSKTQLFPLLQFHWGLRKNILTSKTTAKHTYYGPDPNSAVVVMTKSFLSTQPTILNTHNDKIIGLTSIAVGNGSLYAAGSFDTTISISSSQNPTQSQLTLRTPNNKQIITCIDTFVQNNLLVVVAGEKRGSIIAFTNTLYGCDQASSFSANNSVIDEIRSSLSVSTDHIRTVKHVLTKNTQHPMDLIVVGDGDGRLIIVNVVIAKSTDTLPCEIHFCILQSSLVHESPIVSIQPTNDGFVTIEKDGSLAVWEMDVVNQKEETMNRSEERNEDINEDINEDRNEPRNEQKNELNGYGKRSRGDGKRIHYSLKSISDVTGHQGRAVTCMELVEQKRNQIGTTTTTTTTTNNNNTNKNRNRSNTNTNNNKNKNKNNSSNNNNNNNSSNTNNNNMYEMKCDDVIGIIGTRGVWGTKSKSMRALLKDTTIFGYSIGKHELLWSLPNHRTVSSVLPIGLRYILVVSEVDENEPECLSLWDSVLLKKVRVYPVVSRKTKIGRITRMLPLINGKTKCIDTIVLGTTSGLLLTLDVGF